MCDALKGVSRPPHNGSIQLHAGRNTGSLTLSHYVDGNYRGWTARDGIENRSSSSKLEEKLRRIVDEHKTVLIEEGGVNVEVEGREDNSEQYDQHGLARHVSISIKPHREAGKTGWNAHAFLLELHQILDKLVKPIGT